MHPRSLLPLLLAAAIAQGAALEVREVPLTGERSLVTLDYFAWDASTRRLWVPAGNTASVIVYDEPLERVTTLTGFATAQFELKGRRGRLGPSSVTIAPGTVYVGNRADASICAIDARTLRRGSCLRIASPGQGWAAAPDGVVYIAPTRELWITRGAPPLGIAAADKSITILDASDPRRLRFKSRMALGASAEGYAVDAQRGLFYTNLEERGETIAIDVRRRAIVSRWKSGCAEARGLAVDPVRGFLFVACPDRVVSIDARHGGAIAGSIMTGAGLDNIDYSVDGGLLYAAAATAGTLTVARVGDRGELTPLGVAATAVGARGVVAGSCGHAYVADPYGARILVVTVGADQRYPAACSSKSSA